MTGRRKSALALPLLLAPILAMASGCDRGIGPTTRVVKVHGLPGCPSKGSYARALVVRIDRDRALFDDPWTTQSRIDAPTSEVTLTVPRARMRATLRFGLCSATAVATWDCSAATWLGAVPLDLDARASTVDVTAPKFEVDCAR